MFWLAFWNRCKRGISPHRKRAVAGHIEGAMSLVDDVDQRIVEPLKKRR
jgi:hypothetical protein